MLAHVGVAHLPRRRHFVAELGQAVGVTCEVRGQELQCDGLPEGKVISAVYLAHAALAQRRNDAITGGQEGAGCKPFGRRSEAGLWDECPGEIWIRRLIRTGCFPGGNRLTARWAEAAVFRKFVLAGRTQNHDEGF